MKKLQVHMITSSHVYKFTSSQFDKWTSEEVTSSQVHMITSLHDHKWTSEEVSQNHIKYNRWRAIRIY